MAKPLGLEGVIRSREMGVCKLGLRKLVFRKLHAESHVAHK